MPNRLESALPGNVRIKSGKDIACYMLLFVILHYDDHYGKMDDGQDGHGREWFWLILIVGRLNLAEIGRSEIGRSEIGRG